MQVKDLKENIRNPRKITTSNQSKLEDSMHKYGELNCIVYNRRTKRLIGGHRRKSVLPDDLTIKYTKKYDEPTKAYTVAWGQIELDGELFNYREVDAPEKWETEALLAANKHDGEWDDDKLKLLFHDFPDIDIESTGFDLEEVEYLGVQVDYNFNNDYDDDASYLRDNPGQETYTAKERIPDNVKRTYPNKDVTPSPIVDIPIEEQVDGYNPFETVGQETEVKNKQIVLIIDLETDEDKKNLKKEIKKIVEEYNGKFI